jgi:oligoendopeptidase F
MWVWFALFVALTVLLAWLARQRDEGFLDVAAAQKLIGSVDTAALPLPHEMFRKARELLDRYDRPEFWDHAAQVMDKDPAELARMYLADANRTPQ